MSLFLDIWIGDALHIGENAVVTMERMRGKRARLRITTASNVRLLRDGRDLLPARTRLVDPSAGGDDGRGA